MNTARTFILILLFSFPVFGQPKVEFEVASIRLVSSEEGPSQLTAGIYVDGAQIRGSYLSLKDYIALAYRVKLQQIIGPDWLASQRFDIAAKLPDGSSQSQMPEMLQNLLVDRFGMKMHQDTREFPVYGLEVAKSGLKIHEAADADPVVPGKTPVNVAASGSAAGVSVNLGNGSYYSFSENRFEGKKMSFARLAESLGRFMDRPIVDMTGLQGSYDFNLEVTPEDYRAMLIRSAVNAGVTLPPGALRLLDEPSGDSLVSALEKDGLVLAPRKAPLEVIVIDSMQKLPTD